MYRIWPLQHDKTWTNSKIQRFSQLCSCCRSGGDEEPEERHDRSSEKAQREEEDHRRSCQFLALVRHQRGTLHHRQGGKPTIRQGEKDHEDDRSGVVVKGHDQLRVLYVAKQEDRNEHDPSSGHVAKHPRRHLGEDGVAWQASSDEVEEVEEQERERDEELVLEPARSGLAVLRRLDVLGDRREHGQGHGEGEPDREGRVSNQVQHLPDLRVLRHGRQGGLLEAGAGSSAVAGALVLLAVRSSGLGQSALLDAAVGERLLDNGLIVVVVEEGRHRIGAHCLRGRFRAIALLGVGDGLERVVPGDGQRLEYVVAADADEHHHDAHEEVGEGTVVHGEVVTVVVVVVAFRVVLGSGDRDDRRERDHQARHPLADHGTLRVVRREARGEPKHAAGVQRAAERGDKDAQDGDGQNRVGADVRREHQAGRDDEDSAVQQEREQNALAQRHEMTVLERRAQADELGAAVGDAEHILKHVHRVGAAEPLLEVRASRDERVPGKQTPDTQKDEEAPSKPEPVHRSRRGRGRRAFAVHGQSSANSAPSAIARFTTTGRSRAQEKRPIRSVPRLPASVSAR
mmetsp:Transcript_4930/g.19725  ORF Transcript_4930/g.19725 Transcript_4930/m.19725 type:complete len:571 (+) Transcript_4930:71-1783(+)